ncbi:MAG: AraC family transcriptional regulator [Clostridia bacterium]|nr:AraC family transcriptional regulator [Clostridia bacterium]
MAIHIVYGKYKLSKVVSVEEIVSADYIAGEHIARFMHSHEDAWELAYCMENEIEIYMNSEWIRLKKGECLFIRPGSVHNIRVTDADARSFVVSFTSTNSELLLPLEYHVVTVNPKESKIFENMKAELETTFSRNTGNMHLYTFEPSEYSPLGAEQMIGCYLEQLIILLLRDVTKHGETVAKNGQIRNMAQDYLVDHINTYIAAHYHEHLSVEQIASRFHYSRTHLSTLYKEITGQRIVDVITDVRITCAKELLRRGEESIASIAERSGFSSPQYFTHKFTAIEGCSPSEYAKNHLHPEQTE